MSCGTILVRRGIVVSQSERGGWDVRARALTCVALGRWVAFGRPKMSVWGRAGAGSAPAKVACNTQFAQPNLELIFHGPAPRSPHRLAVRLRHSRSNKSTEYSLPGATQLSQVRSISRSGQDVLHVGVKRDPTNFSTPAMRVTL